MSESKKDISEMMKDFESIKDRIVAKVISGEEHPEILADRPHTDMGDLAAVYYVHIDNADNLEGVKDMSDGISAGIVITNEIAEDLGVTEADLREAALVNMPSINQPSIDTLSNVIMGMTVPDIMASEDMTREEAEAAFRESDPLDDPQIYVISNESRVNGAAVIIDPEVSRQVSERCGGDFYLLPSSVHELLAVAKDGTMDHQMLESMVQDINMTEVSPEDKLSDHVYEYDAMEQKLSRADLSGTEKVDMLAVFRGEGKEKEAELGSLNAGKAEKSTRPSLKDKLTANREKAAVINAGHEAPGRKLATEIA